MIDFKEAIIFQDDDILVINKPATIPVQPDKTDDPSILTFFQKNLNRELFLVHRLDRPVSGIVIFGKKKKVAQILSQQFKIKMVNKRYLALVSNAPNEKEGSLFHHLEKNSKKAKSFIAKVESNKTKRAKLDYKTIAKTDKYFVLEITPSTGKFHQIRAQLAAINCPIKGDVKYGARRANKDRSIHLHAWKIEFLHPTTEEKMKFSATLPDDSLWNAVLPLISK